MIKVTEEMINDARKLIATNPMDCVGYRLLIKTIGAISGLEEFEKEQFPTLAKGGFQAKSDGQKDKEDRGDQYGIVVSCGAGAFKSAALGGVNWVNEGDIVFFDRYAGVSINVPPGSKDIYRLMNDESLLGRIVKDDE